MVKFYDHDQVKIIDDKEEAFGFVGSVVDDCDQDAVLVYIDDLTQTVTFSSDQLELIDE